MAKYLFKDERTDMTDTTYWGNLEVDNCGITSLEGCPSLVKGDFSCTDNKLKSLKFCPPTVEGNFYCSNNNLTTLENGPTRVKGEYSCSQNDLTTLKGVPKHIAKSFFCNSNYNLKSLDYAPETVGGDIAIGDCGFTSLKNFPNCGGEIKIAGGKFTDFVGIQETVNGDLTAHSNSSLTSLKGAPTKINGTFDIMWCPNLKDPISQIIENQIIADYYITDAGAFDYSKIVDKIKYKTIKRKGFRTLLGIDK